MYLYLRPGFILYHVVGVYGNYISVIFSSYIEDIVFPANKGKIIFVRGRDNVLLMDGYVYLKTFVTVKQHEEYI